MKNYFVLGSVIAFQIITLAILGISGVASHHSPVLLVVLIILGIILDYFVYKSFSVIREVGENEKAIMETASLQDAMNLYRLKAEQNLITLEELQDNYIHQLTDIKDHLSSDKALLDQEIKKTSQSLQDVFTEIYTNNTIINTILVLKKTYGLQAGIDISYSIDVPDNLPVTELDICTLLCNMLDNGIEAALKCPYDSRFVKLQIKTNNEYLFVTTKNSVFNESGTIDFSKSAKSATDEHGFGVELIRSITNKYNGHLSINHNSQKNVQVIAALNISMNSTRH